MRENNMNNYTTVNVVNKIDLKALFELFYTNWRILKTKSSLHNKKINYPEYLLNKKQQEKSIKFYSFLTMLIQRTITLRSSKAQKKFFIFRIYTTRVYQMFKIMFYFETLHEFVSIFIKMKMPMHVSL